MDLLVEQHIRDIVNPKVIKETEIVTPELLGQSFFLHLTPDKNRVKYEPKISKRQALNEDQTLPRVTVAPTLLGCFIGYSGAVPQTLNYAPDENNKNYRQGYYINKIPFQYALKPTNKMVYDARRSDEHWLFTYNAETKEFPHTQIGKMFISSIIVNNRTNNVPDVWIELYVEVNDPLGILFSKNITLKQGYWKIYGPGDINQLSWDKDKKFTAIEISRNDYGSVKNRSAAMLSETIPPSMLW